MFSEKKVLFKLWRKYKEDRTIKNFNVFNCVNEASVDHFLVKVAVSFLKILNFQISMSFVQWMQRFYVNHHLPFLLPWSQRWCADGWLPIPLTCPFSSPSCTKRPSHQKEFAPDYNRQALLYSIVVDGMQLLLVNNITTICFLLSF